MQMLSNQNLKKTQTPKMSTHICFFFISSNNIFLSLDL